MNNQLDRNGMRDETEEHIPVWDDKPRYSSSYSKRKSRKDKEKEREAESRQNYTAGLVTLTTVGASLVTIYGAMIGSGSEVFAPKTVPACSNQYPFQPVKNEHEKDDSGALDAYGRNGQILGHCPLKHTQVDAKVSGYTARVTVKQIFRNPFKETIEAKYRFPLSHEGAVDEMTMKIGDRTINGEIKRREEAAQIYEQARNTGHVASLLDQERTNIFTQSIANLEPGKQIEITIKYTEILAYKDGAFQFVFPTVVGPRIEAYGNTAAYTPSSNTILTALTGAPTRTNTVGSETRSGHDISINVAVDAGLPIEKLTSRLHGIIAQQPSQNIALVSLKQAATIPNRDFVLDIGVAQKQLKSGYIATRHGNDGYVTFMVVPPQKVQPKEIAPRELLFLVDCSGSQAGAPIQKSKETLKYVVNHVNDNDTFQIITFNDNVKTLFSKPEKMTVSRKMQAKFFIDGITALGGTWMAPAVETACQYPAEDNRLRIVSFMTDGFVDNDYEIVGLVKRLRGSSRWFPFGIGDSVNRTLIDAIAREGGGESEFVLLNDGPEKIASKFYERIASPVFTDVTIRGNGIELLDVYPRSVSDVWSEKPLFFKARYTRPGKGMVVISGFAQGKQFEQMLEVDLPAESVNNSQIGQIWARAKIDSLMSEDWEGAQQGIVSDHIRNETVKTALSHHLISQFTSFVAVDTETVTHGLSVATCDVPVETPQGTWAPVNQSAAAAPSTVSLNTPASNNYRAAAPGSFSTTQNNYCGTQNSFSGNPNRSAPPSPSTQAPLIDRAFAGVVTQLNSLSCAAGSASCAGAPATPYSMPAKQERAFSDYFTPEGIAFLTIAFFWSPFGIVTVSLLSLIGLFKLYIAIGNATAPRAEQVSTEVTDRP